MSLTVIPIDPYHKVLGMLVPLLAQRLDENLQTLGDESGVILSQFMSLLWAKSPDVLLLAAIDAKGNIKGHVAATFQASDTGRQVFHTQPRQDEPAENDAIGEMLVEIEKWAKFHNAEELVLATRRFDAKWAKKHGYEISRYYLSKEVK